MVTQQRDGLRRLGDNDDETNMTQRCEFYLHEVGERDANHQQFVNDLEQVGTGQHAVLQTIAQKVTVIRQHVIQVGHLHSSSSKLIQYTGNFQNCRSVFLKCQIAFLPYKQQRHCSLIVGYFFKKTTDFINDDK